MKKIILGATLLVAGLFGTVNAQIQEGNWMVGASVANMKFTNGFDMSLTPKLGYFVKDNWAIGGQVGLKVTSPEGTSATQTSYTVGAFTRYYFSDGQVDNLLNNGRFFAEGTVGFGGDNSNVGSSTNGIDLGIGAGYSYFVTKNVGLEGLLKYQGLAGGGNNNFNGNLYLGVGFQIYLPSAKAKAALRDKK